MKHSHKLRNTLITAGLSCTALAAYNRYTCKKADSASFLNCRIPSSQFGWKLGNIHYTKQGSGSPILLIHDYLSFSGAWEWNALSQRLSKNHTVYALDLPGCGRSEKSFTAYTSYLYVQLISDFISKLIREPVILVVSGHSVLPAVMLAKSEPALFRQIIALNPSAPHHPNVCELLLGKLFLTPLIGTFAYNMFLTPARLQSSFEQARLFHSRELQAAYRKAFWQGAHMNRAHGKYLLASYLLGYMDSDLSFSLKKLAVPFSILTGSDVSGAEEAILSYRRQNPQIPVRQVEDGRLMMQMEQAEEVANRIYDLL